MQKVTRVGKYYRWAQGVFNSPRMSKGPQAWYIMLLSAIIFLFPYTIPGTTYLSLGSYGMLALVPIGIAAYLRPIRGNIIISGVIGIAIFTKIMTDVGSKWPTSLTSNYVLGVSLGLIFGIVTSKFRLLGLQLEAARQALQQQALTDALTGLHNHRSIVEQLELAYREAHERQRSLSLIFFDADHFKHINDRYGHASGDEVLSELAARARTSIRSGDQVGRMGGEEFVLLLPDTDTEEALQVAERLRAVIEASPVATSEVAGGIPVTISVGVATFPTDAQTVKELLDHADQAMYCAKRMGRNRVQSFHEGQQLELSSALA